MPITSSIASYESSILIIIVESLSMIDLAVSCPNQSSDTQMPIIVDVLMLPPIHIALAHTE